MAQRAGPAPCPTAAGAYRLLATIYNSAIREDLIVRSPCRVEGAGREQAVERPTATISECQRAVDATPAPYRVALLLGSWGQLRRGEVLALQRGDVDLSAGSVRVQRGWTLTENGQTVLGPPKSDAGKRTLFLPPHVQVAIAGHLEDFVGPQRDAWLFSPVGDELVHPRKFARVWERAREAAGHTDPRFHDLRHSGLTWVEIGDVAPDASFDMVRDRWPTGPLCPLRKSVPTRRRRAGQVPRRGAGAHGSVGDDDAEDTKARTTRQATENAAQHVASEWRTARRGPARSGHSSLGDRCRRLSR